MAIAQPRFTTPACNGTLSRNNPHIEGTGEPRTNVSICIAGHGGELASVFCDERAHFSANLNLSGVPNGSLTITARCVLANEDSGWGPYHTLTVC